VRRVLPARGDLANPLGESDERERQFGRQNDQVCGLVVTKLAENVVEDEDDL
jgi:hypothetical protein